MDNSQMRLIRYLFMDYDQRPRAYKSVQYKCSLNFHVETCHLEKQKKR